MSLDTKRIGRRSLAVAGAGVATLLAFTSWAAEATIRSRSIAAAATFNDDITLDGGTGDDTLDGGDGDDVLAGGSDDDHRR